MKRKTIFLAIAISLLAGCDSVAISPTTQMTFTSTPTAIFTSIPPAYNITPSPDATLTNTLDSAFVSRCLEVDGGEIALQTKASGTIVLDRGFYGDHSLLNLQTNVEYKVPPVAGDVFNYRWAISPDGNLLAISDNLQNANGQSGKMILSVLNARAEILEKITFKMAGFSNIRWLDNQNIILYTTQTPKDGTVIFFNPFTRAQRNISNDLPDYYFENYLLPGISWLIEYSPSLEWGVYLGRTQTGKLGFVIRDFANGQTLWQIEDSIGEYQRPIWSPVADEVALVASGQLYVVDRSGHAKPILNEKQQKQVEQPSWSPDGRYIAFWNIYDSLMLYDSQSEEVYDLCYKGDHLSPLIWSPNSRQIAIPADLGDNSVLVDIQKSRVYKLTAIPEIIYPVGWMNSMP